MFIWLALIDNREFIMIILKYLLPLISVIHLYQIVIIQSHTPPFQLGYLYKICGSKQPLGIPDLLDKHLSNNAKHMLPAWFLSLSSTLGIGT